MSSNLRILQTIISIYDTIIGQMCITVGMTKYETIFIYRNFKHHFKTINGFKIKIRLSLSLIQSDMEFFKIL